MLTDRQQKILQLIVQLYGRYKEPIGSKRLLEESVLNVSSATIRNDMNSLEKHGYLSKTHTSSGRVPSEDGYRFYINWLLSEDLPEEKNQEALWESSDFQSDEHHDVFQLAKLSADTISEVTGYVTVLLTTGSEAHTITEFRLVYIDQNSFIGIIMTDKGLIDSYLFKVPFMIDETAMQTLSDVLSKELIDVSLEDAKQKAKLTLPLFVQRHIGYQIDFTPLFERVLFNILSERYYVSGKNHLFNILDIHEGAETFQRLFNFVDGSSAMYKLLEAANPHVDVIYGLKNSTGTFNQLSMITGKYVYQDQQIIVGLIGPTTMAYKDNLRLMTHVITQLANR